MDASYDDLAKCESFLREMSGLRCVGSSWGQGKKIILDVDDGIKSRTWERFRENASFEVIVAAHEDGKEI